MNLRNCINLLFDRFVSKMLLVLGQKYILIPPISEGKETEKLQLR
jgi:hypothetical protein